MDLFDLVLAGFEKAEPVGVWLTLLLLARLRKAVDGVKRDQQAIKRRLGIVEERVIPASIPLDPFPAR